MPIHPVDMPYAESLAQDKEMAVFADALGYDEAFFGEHVSDASETITSSLIFVALLGEITKNMRLGTGVVNLPHGHPAALAAQIAMVDTLLNGRLILGIGPGGLASDMEIFGTLEADRNSMFIESIDHILALWSGSAPYNLEGQHWSISTAKTHIPDLGQGVIPKPLQAPHPEIVCTALAPYSKGVEKLAERGWSVVSSNFLQDDGVKSHWDAYARGCAAIGADADGDRWRVVRTIFVHEDPDIVEAYAFGDGGPYHYMYNQIYQKLKRADKLAVFKERFDQPDDEITLDYVMRKTIIAGSPEQVADDILRLRDHVGPFGTLMYTGVDWQDEAIGRNSMRLLAERVMPRVNA